MQRRPSHSARMRSLYATPKKRKLPWRFLCLPSNRQKSRSFSGGIKSPVAVRDWMVECVGSPHALQSTWIAHPSQPDRPQGTLRVSDGLLVANDVVEFALCSRRRAGQSARVALASRRTRRWPCSSDALALRFGSTCCRRARRAPTRGREVARAGGNARARSTVASSSASVLWDAHRGCALRRVG